MALGVRKPSRRESLRVGSYRYLVSVRRATRSPDGQGGFTETNSEVSQEWMYVEAMSTARRFFAAQVTESATHDAWFRERGVDCKAGDYLVLPDATALQVIQLLRDPDGSSRVTAREVPAGEAALA